MGTYATEAFVHFLKRVYKLNPEEILDIHLSGDKIHITMTKNEMTIPTNDVLPYVQMGCLICPDYTGIFSDISAGMSENYPGYTVLIVRNPETKKIVEDAYNDHYIEIKPGSANLIDELNFRAQVKLMRAVKYASMLL